jgi:hypothetical protein
MISATRIAAKPSTFYGPDFVAIDFQRTGTATIALLSLGGGVSNAVDSAVNPMANIGR